MEGWPEDGYFCGWSRTPVLHVRLHVPTAVEAQAGQAGRDRLPARSATSVELVGGIRPADLAFLVMGRYIYQGGRIEQNWIVCLFDL